MSLVTAILITFTFSSYAFAATDIQPKLSVQQAQAQKALKELEKIKKMEVKNVKENSKKKELTLVIDNEENLITYDKKTKEIYINGELGVTDVAFNEEVVTDGEVVSETEDSNKISALSSVPLYNIGDYNQSSGYFVQTRYLSGSFNLITVSVTAIAGTLALIFTKKPATSALYSAAGAVLSSLVAIDQYQIKWKLYSFKDYYKESRYLDRLGVYNYKDSQICQINHYWGKVS
jgi:hypothetical protein